MAGPDPRRSRAPGFTTHLRVYEPLAAFPASERARWEAYTAEARATGGLLDGPAAVRAEHATALAALVRPVLEVGPEQALVRVHDGLAYVCPLDTQRRVLESLLEFRDGLADIVADAFVPRALAERAEAELSALATARAGAESPEADPRPAHVVTATWHVPLAWFLLVEASEVTVVPGTGPGDPERSVTCATTMASARRRAARALDLLRRTIPEAPTVRGLEAAARWLEEFHPYSRVEVDYGDLVHVLGDDFLAYDTSVADLTEGMALLRSGDGPGAAAVYERVVTRWRPVQAKETSS